MSLAVATVVTVVEVRIGVIICLSASGAEAMQHQCTSVHMGGVTGPV